MIYENKLNELIGKKYSKDYDCYAFVAELLDIDDINKISTDIFNFFKYNKEYKEIIYRELDKPKIGCVVSFGNNQHIAVLVDKEIIAHNIPNQGVVLQNINKITLKKRYLEIIDDFSRKDFNR